MNTGTYGLATPIRGPVSSGPGLAGLAQEQQSSATSMLGKVAQLEQQRDEQNKARSDANKSGLGALGSGLGSLGGVLAGGPVFGLIGGVLGGLGSKLF